MTILYKLTDQNGYTRAGEDNQCLWGEGVTHSGTGEGELCGPGYIHAYTSPLLAVLFNPIHACISNPKLWECEGEVIKTDRGMKVGCISLMTIKEIELPKISNNQKIKFAILCVKEVCKEPVWNAWADSWLSGKDRSANAARAAYAAARAAAYAAYAADAAAYAAYAANAAAYAAYAAANAANAAARAANAGLDLIAMAEQAMEV